MNAVNSQNIDDMFSTVSFFVTEPGAFIDPIGDHEVGEKFSITGTTNLAVDDDLMVEVYSSSFAPTRKGQPNEFSGKSGIVKVEPGAGSSNRWSFDIDASGFVPGEYIVKVTAVNRQVSGTTTFSLVSHKVRTTLPTTVSPVLTSLPPSAAPATPSGAPTTKSVPLPAGLIIAGLAAALPAARSLLRNKV